MPNETKPFLRDEQINAINQMRNGCILKGGVGSGKSRTSLYYYFKEQGGTMFPEFVPMKNPLDLYIITTAKKRDTMEFEEEMAPFRMSVYPELNMYNNKIIVDSWNNIQKYKDVKDAFFIFDEQKVTGSGKWSKTFIKISKSNKWILLTATPGDTWSDYIPVFIANGFYKNRTQFNLEHVVYSYYGNYPKISRYLNTGKLLRLRNSITVEMDIKRDAVPHHEDIYCSYDQTLYKNTIKNRWNPYTNEPIADASSLCLTLRKIVNMSASRQLKLLEITEEHPRVIVFYNFDYELDILKNIYYGDDFEIAEWNGHKHQPIPKGNKWVYLVHYSSGEAWNCIKTDTIVFYSQTYSYKTMIQAAGRIDRMNTPYKDLYYYHIKSRSSIDLEISKALSKKKNFNELDFANF